MRVPEIIFKTRIGDNQSLGGGCSIGGQWKDVSTTDLFKNKKLFYFHCQAPIHPPVLLNNYQDMKKNIKI